MIKSNGDRPNSMKTSKLLVARVFVAASILIAFSAIAVGQDGRLSIRYHMAMSHPNSHLFEVSIEVQKPSDVLIDTLDFQMPKWSPGRYAVFDFAKNVQEVRARAECLAGMDCKLAAPPLTRVDDQTWHVDLASLHLREVSIFLDY